MLRYIVPETIVESFILYSGSGRNIRIRFTQSKRCNNSKFRPHFLALFPSTVEWAQEWYQWQTKITSLHSRSRHTHFRKRLKIRCKTYTVSESREKVFGILILVPSSRTMLATDDFLFKSPAFSASKVVVRNSKELSITDTSVEVIQFLSRVWLSNLLAGQLQGLYWRVCTCDLVRWVL